MSTDTIHELAKATDTRLANLNDQYNTLDQQRRWAADTIHSAAGDRKQDTHLVRYERARWGLTLDEAKAVTPKTAWDQQDHAKALAKLATIEADMAKIEAAMDECDQVWKDNGCWNRFFVVPGGHIHSSRNCSTCNNGAEPTMFGWLPQLSGLDEAAAVKDQGPLLCTVCFPSAPTEWTNGKELEEAAKLAARCPGSGEYVKVTNWQAKYARCPHCKALPARSQKTGRLRAHKPVTKD